MYFSLYFQDGGKMKLNLDEDRIVWPGGLTQKPTGLMIPTHLKVLTIVETPFVYARKLDPDAIEAYKRQSKKASAAFGDDKGLSGVMDFIGGSVEDEDDWMVGGGGSSGKNGASGNGAGSGGKSDSGAQSGDASASTASHLEDQDFPEGHCDPVREIPCPLYDKSGKTLRQQC